MLPLAVESAENAVLPLATRLLPLAVKTVAVTPEPQVKTPPDRPQVPLDDFKVKPLPEAVAVYVAQVPLVYQVPAEIKQPFVEPPAATFR